MGHRHRPPMNMGQVLKNNMTYTKGQLGEKFAKLPEEVQEAIIAVETAETVSRIGAKYALHIDQVGELADEIGLVMLGLNRPNDFVTHIIARLGLDRAVAEAIAREVNDQIFLKIRESLQALPEAGEDTEANEAIGGVEPIPASPPPPETLPTDLPNRDEIIDGIENPKATPADTVFEQKMEKLFRIPREEVDLDPYLEKPK